MTGLDDVNVLFKKEDELHREFQLIGMVDAIIDDLKRLAKEHEDPDNEYSVENCQDEYGGEAITLEDRMKEVEEINDLIVQLKEGQFEEWFNRIPLKKNGTFHKGRVITIWRGYTFEHYWEDSYGYNGPELIIRTVDDKEAILGVDWRMRKI